jgi:hypothetical protein
LRVGLPKEVRSCTEKRVNYCLGSAGIDRAEVQTIEAILKMSAQQLAGPRQQGRRHDSRGDGGDRPAIFKAVCSRFSVVSQL